MSTTAGETTTAGGASSSSVLRIGTVNYIDSLNPFNYIEAQSYERDDHDLPAARPVRPRDEVRGRLGQLVGRRRQTARTGRSICGPNTKWSDGQPLTAADAAWTINTTVKYADGPGGGRRGGARTRQERRRRPDPTTLVIHYESPVGNVLAQLETFFVLPKHVWAAEGRAPTARG